MVYMVNIGYATNVHICVVAVYNKLVWSLL